MTSRLLVDLGRVVSWLAMIPIAIVLVAWAFWLVVWMEGGCDPSGPRDEIVWETPRVVEAEAAPPEGAP